MQIAIIGTGKMAKGIAYGLRETSHDITLASRDPARAEALAQVMAEEHGRRYHGGSYESAAARADVTFLAIPYKHALETVGRLQLALDDRILVDITNPLNDSFDGLTTREGISGAEEIDRRAGGRVRVVGALKNTFAGTFAEPNISGGPAPDVFIVGDDSEAKQIVGDLVRAIGFGAIDAGPLKVARTIERMTVLIIDLAQRYNWNWNAGFKIVH